MHTRMRRVTKAQVRAWHALQSKCQSSRHTCNTMHPGPSLHADDLFLNASRSRDRSLTVTTGRLQSFRPIIRHFVALHRMCCAATWQLPQSTRHHRLNTCKDNFDSSSTSSYRSMPSQQSSEGMSGNAPKATRTKRPQVAKACKACQRRRSKVRTTWQVWPVLTRAV